MNFEFKTIGEIVNKGVPCLVQQATAPWSSKQFWIAWRTCNDPALKESIQIRRDGERMTLTRIIPRDSKLKLPPIPVPYYLKSTRHLLDYQPAAVAPMVRSLLNHGCAIDGSDTGLGKTYVSLAVCRELAMRPGVVCKKAGIAGWRRACEYMGIDPLFIINWEMARTGNFPFAPRKHHAFEPRWVYSWKVPKNAVVIFDECHVACNDGTLNNQLWTSAKGKNCMFLSATFSDRPVRLASLMEMLGVCTRAQFTMWLRARGNFMNAHNELESMAPVQDMKEIHKILYPRFGARLSYGDPAVKHHFPGVVHQVELITLDNSVRITQNTLYSEFVKKAREYKEAGRQHADTMVMELRYRQAAEIMKVPVLADFAADYMQAGLSVCIFVNYRETLAALAKMLKTRSMIFGDQDRFGISRDGVIAEFQANNSRIILLMSEAGGQSIDLHDLKGAHQRISLVCPTYNPITLKQVLGRTRRARSKTIPIIKLVYAAGTVEEKVAQSVAQKLDNIEALNRGDLMESDIFDIQEKQ
jgi:hypothetical protein